MNSGNSEQQWRQQSQSQQQEHYEQQQHQSSNGQQPGQQLRVNELTEELMQKQSKLNELMKESAHKRAANAQLQNRIFSINTKVAKAHATKNEIAKICNSTPGWELEIQRKLNQCLYTMQSCKHFAGTSNEIGDEDCNLDLMKKEIRRLELELEQLPTEAELQRYASENRKMLESKRKIKDPKAESAEEDEAQNTNEKLTKSPELPTQAKQPISSNSPTQIQPVPLKQEKEPINPNSLVDQFFLDIYFASSKKGTSSADVTSTKIDPDDVRSERTKGGYSFTLSDDSSDDGLP